jgi:hypothetical protein
MIIWAGCLDFGYTPYSIGVRFADRNVFTPSLPQYDFFLALVQYWH